MVITSNQVSSILYLVSSFQLKSLFCSFFQDKVKTKFFEVFQTPEARRQTLHGNTAPGVLPCLTAFDIFLDINETSFYYP